MPRELKPCGTQAAFMRHQRRHEDSDTCGCRDAWNAYYRDWCRADYALRKRLGRPRRKTGAPA